MKKATGSEPPWTDDPILQANRFTNVRRMDDKVSVWLMDNWYRPFFNHSNMLYAVALARFVNLPRSLVGLSAFLFEDKINWKHVKTYLRSVKKNEPTVFNAAYMVRGDTRDPDKIESVVDRYVKPLEGKVLDTSSMQKTHAIVQACHGFGSFMAGQVTADLRWAVKGAWADRDYWAPMGPGSRRGMNRLHGRFGKPEGKLLKQEQFQWELQMLIKEVRKKVDPNCRMEAMDFQNCLCEWDKHERVLWGQGRAKQRYHGRGE